MQIKLETVGDRTFVRLNDGYTVLEFDGEVVDSKLAVKKDEEDVGLFTNSVVPRVGPTEYTLSLTFTGVHTLQLLEEDLL